MADKVRSTETAGKTISEEDVRGYLGLRKGGAKLGRRLTNAVISVINMFVCPHYRNFVDVKTSASEIVESVNTNLERSKALARRFLDQFVRLAGIGKEHVDDRLGTASSTRAWLHAICFPVFAPLENKASAYIWRKIELMKRIEDGERMAVEKGAHMEEEKATTDLLFVAKEFMNKVVDTGTRAKNLGQDRMQGASLINNVVAQRSFEVTGIQKLLGLSDEKVEKAILCTTLVNEPGQFLTLDNVDSFIQVAQSKLPEEWKSKLGIVPEPMQEAVSVMSNGMGRLSQKKESPLAP